MSNNQNILLLFFAITTLAITCIALKMPVVEGAVILTNSSQSVINPVIIDPFASPTQEEPPTVLLTPDNAKSLTNQEITNSFIKTTTPFVVSSVSPSAVIQPSTNLNPPFKTCNVEATDQDATSEAKYKIKGKSDLKELSGVNGPQTLEIKLDINLNPPTSFIDINDVVKSTIQYGNKEVDLKLNNDEFTVITETKVQGALLIQNNPPFRMCQDNAAPTVHAIYKIQFDHANIDNVLQTSQGTQDVEIILTNELLAGTKPTGELIVDGDNNASLGGFVVESQCELTAT
jgi:hypothetical protein